jgi:hypothetical protein
MTSSSLPQSPTSLLAGSRRRSRWALIGIVGAVLLTIGAVAVAQRGSFQRGRRGEYGGDPRNGVPEWKNTERFKHDVFTFARVRFSSYGGRGGWGDGHDYGKWRTDYPDSDLNFSYRLHQLTALETDSNGVIVELTDENLFDYPWLYMIEPGYMVLSDEEVNGLRRYLLNGGFLMVDDFWGSREWDNFYEQIKRVFPDREPKELPLEHEIFHCVYDMAKKPQVPSIHSPWESGYTTDRPHDPSCIDVSYKALLDDKGRMMAIICHNTDLGDGWEREGESAEYFKQFAEKWSYPMGINIVTYAMTH